MDIIVPRDLAAPLGPNQWYIGDLIGLALVEASGERARRGGFRTRGRSGALARGARFREERRTRFRAKRGTRLARALPQRIRRRRSTSLTARSSSSLPGSSTNEVNRPQPFPRDTSRLFRKLRHGEGRRTRARVLRARDIRDYATDKHHKCDDEVFGGGPGMLMLPGPLCGALEAARFSQ